MKRKGIAILLSLLFCLNSLTFLGCSGEEIEHICSFDKQIVNQKFKISSATCGEKAKYYYSCSCGEKGTEYFYFGEKTECSYGNWTSVGDGTHKKVCVYNDTHVVVEDCHGGTATETERAVCVECNTAYGVTLKHQHNYNIKNTSGEYYVSGYPCKKGALYYYSCECGKKGSATFALEEAKPHLFGDVYYSYNSEQHYKSCIYGCGEKKIENCQIINGYCVCGRDNKLKISLFFNRGGVQSGWFYDVEKRFEEATKYKVYGNKTGIDLEWKDATLTDYNGMPSSDYNIYMDEGDGSFVKHVNSGYYMDITDVATSVNPYDGKTIASKLGGTTGTYMKDGKYYAFPWKQFFTGISYNADIFEKYGLYFADTTSGVPYTGNVGYNGKPCYFIAENGSAEKTAGLDGIKGTYDDGLPTTLEELMALCHKIKELGVNWFPFACTGGRHEDYTNYLTRAIVIGLEGAERFGNYTDCDGEMEIVTGYTSEKLWGLNDVYVPTTQLVQVKANARSTWINISKSVARYYAIAFIKYLTQNKMICDCIRSSWSNNISVQENFIFSDTYMNENTHHSAMIMEGSYWYTESEHNGNFGKWDSYMVGEDRPEFGIMPYPARINGSVTGEEPFLASMCSNANVFINNNLMNDYENNKYVIEACKEFLYFFYSDQEIANYIEATGQSRAKTDFDWQSLVYEKDGNGNYKNGLNGTQRVIKADCKLSNCQITVLELERDAIVLAQEPTAVNPNNLFRLGNVSSLMKPELGVFYSVFKNGNMTVQEAFEATFVGGLE